MKQLVANTLVAYVDGELDPEAASQVERVLAEDAEARQTVAVLRETAVLVRGAHAHILHETVPDRLVDVIGDTPDAESHAGDEVPERLVNMILDAPESNADDRRDESRSSTVIPLARRRSVAAVAAAAAFGAVMLGSFYAGHYGALTGTSAERVEQARAVAAMNDPFREAAFQNALENKKSQEAVVWENPESGVGGAIIPVKTYRRTDGTFCRVFRTVDTAARPTQPNVGMACREAGQEGRWIKTVEAVAGPDGPARLKY